MRHAALLLVLLLVLSGCAALAQLGGLEVCVAAGRGASPSASGVPSASPTVVVIAVPTAAPSVAPVATVAPDAGAR